ncbi:MAG TPA: hypothetical protein VN039_13685 [Nitrospira sp.]|nr:hypothetical protein [Nitrospira sp.]
MNKTEAPKTADLRNQIEALVQLNDRGALVPHGIGELARSLLLSASDTITSLEAEVERLNKCWTKAEDDFDRAVETIDSLKAQLAEADEVIRPFAEAAQIKGVHDMGARSVYPAGPIRVSHVRRASQYLKGREG